MPTVQVPDPSAPRRAAEVPSRSDPVVAAASQVLGGPLGRHAAWAPGDRPLPWQPVATALLALSSVAMAGAVAAKAHCLRVGWSTPDQFWHACYSDLPAVYRSSGISQGAMPFVAGEGATVLDQPVLAGASLWLVGLVVPDGSDLSRTRWYVGLWAVLLTAALAVAVVLTVRSVRRAPWSAAHLAVSPVLVTVGLVSVDLLAVLLTSAGLWLWGRSRVVAAGVLLGLAVATRTYPLVVLVAIGLLCARTGQLRVWGRLVAAAAAAFGTVLLPVALSWASAAFAPYAGWWGDGAGYGSPWMIPQLLQQAPSWMLPGLLGRPLPTGVVGALAVCGWVLALAAGAVLALASARRPTVAEVSLVMLVIVAVTGKALPVQAALWLLPLLALTYQRWRDHLVWAGVEVVSFLAVWLYIAGFTTANRGLQGHVYALFVVARVVAWSAFGVRVWLRARARPAVEEARDGRDGRDEEEWPDAEPVEELDELAGPLAGRPDALLVRFS